MLANINYGRNMLEASKETQKLVGRSTRKLDGEGFENSQLNEVAELLKAHTEDLSEEETEHVVTADKGEERETDDQNKGHEQRLIIFPASRQWNWPTAL